MPVPHSAARLTTMVPNAARRPARGGRPVVTAALFLAAVFHDRQRLALDELAHGVDTAQGQDGVAHGGLDEHGQVAARRHLQHDAPDGHAEYLLCLILYRQAFEAFGVGADQVNHQAQLHFAPHRGFAEDGADIEQAQTAHFEQVQQQLWAMAFDDAGGNARELDRVVGHQAVPARDQFKRELALAQAGFARDEHTHSQDVEKHAVHERFGCEAFAQVDAQQVDELRSVDMRGEQGDAVGCAEAAQAIGRGQAFGDEDGGYATGAQFVEQMLTAVGVEVVVVGEFFGSQYLHPGRVDEVQVADQIGAGATEVVRYGLTCGLFAGDPLEVDAVCVVGDEFLQGQHGPYSWAGGLVRIWCTTAGSVSVARAWRMSASDMSRAISACSSRLVCVAFSGTSRMNSRLAARPSVASV